MIQSRVGRVEDIAPNRMTEIKITSARKHTA